jgi:hypothetical protein
MSKVKFIVKTPYNLVPQEKPVHRDGKTFMQTFYIRPAFLDAPKRKAPPAAEQLGFDFESGEGTGAGLSPSKDTKAPGGGLVTEKEVRRRAKTEDVYHDVGSKIGRAKKDLAAERLNLENLADLEKDKAVAFDAVQKKNILPAYDPADMLAAGFRPENILLIKTMAKLLPDRPAEDSQEARESYVHDLTALADVFENSKGEADLITKIFELGVLSRDTPPILEEGKQYASPPRRRYHQRIHDGEQSLFYNMGKAFYLYEKKARIQTSVEETKHLSEMRYRVGSHYNHSDAKHIERAWSAADEIASYDNSVSDGSLTPEEARKSQMTLIGFFFEPKKAKHKGEGEKWIFKREVSEKVQRTGGRAIDANEPEKYLEAFGMRAVEYGNYVLADKESAKYHTTRCAEALADLADVLGLEDRQVSYNGRLALAFGARGSGRASAHYEPVRKVINLTKWAGGGSLAHEWGHFLDNTAYGINAQENGSGNGGSVNYLSHAGGDRGDPIRQAMAVVMKSMETQERATSIDVKDAENVYAEIMAKNKYDTERSNMESLYRRYFMDSTFSEPVSVAKKAQGIIDRLWQQKSWRRAFNMSQFGPRFVKYVVGKSGIGAAFPEGKIEYSSRSASDFAATAAEMGGYWNRSHEKFARAFESYVEDKLMAAGRKSTYLVTGTGVGAMRGYGKSIYPTGSHRQEMVQAFDQLVAALKEKDYFKKAQAIMEARWVS